MEFYLFSAIEIEELLERQATEEERREGGRQRSPTPG